MRNNFKLLASFVAAIFMMSACSLATEELSIYNDDITIGVEIPTQAIGRSAVTIPSGYTMRCILQLMNEQGFIVGAQKVSTVNSDGTVSFIVTAKERKTAKGALLWADYIDANKNSVYDTADLKAISYNTTGFDLAKNETTLMSVMDAFCGKVEALDKNISVGLTRPFTYVCFSPSDASEYANASSLRVSYTAPSSFNVQTSKTSSTADITLTNASFKASETPWFTTFLFASNSQSYLDKEITLAMSGDIESTFTIPANTIPLNANYQVNLTATVGSPDITITVTINPDISNSGGANAGSGSSGGDEGTSTPPATPTGEFKVGAYIGANGTVVTSATDALAVVYYVGAMGTDIASAYGESFANKTIKGYAVALENVADTHLATPGFASWGGSADTFTNGMQRATIFWNSFDAEAFKTEYDEWVSDNSISTITTSGWYVPDAAQLLSWVKMLYNATDNSTTASGTTEFKALFPVDKMFESGKNEAKYASSQAIDNKTLSTITIYNDTQVYSVTSNIGGIPVSDPLLCRPIVTIFE